MFIEQRLLFRGTPVKHQEIPVSISSMIHRHYISKAQDMSTDTVQFISLSPVTSTLVGTTTEEVMLLRLQSEDMSQVDAFIRSLISADETAGATFEGEEVSMM